MKTRYRLPDGKFIELSETLNVNDPAFENWLLEKASEITHSLQNPKLAISIAKNSLLSFQNKTLPHLRSIEEILASHKPSKANALLKENDFQLLFLNKKVAAFIPQVKEVSYRIDLVYLASKIAPPFLTVHNQDDLYRAIESAGVVCLDWKKDKEWLKPLIFEGIRPLFSSALRATLKGVSHLRAFIMQAPLAPATLTWQGMAAYYVLSTIGATVFTSYSAKFINKVAHDYFFSSNRKRATYLGNDVDAQLINQMLKTYSFGQRESVPHFTQAEIERNLERNGYLVPRRQPSTAAPRR